MIDAKSAVYEIANFIQGIEQLTVTTLRNVIGSLDLEQTLTSRDQINGQLRGVLDEATGRWGIRVNRVELKAIDPPHSVQDSMEKQMRAERDRRAAILTAEGVKQSPILTAEGEKQSQILRAEGSAQARILEAQGQARAIHAGLRRDPPRQARPEAAGLPVPPGAAADRARRLQQDVDHPERADRRPQGHRRRARRRPRQAAQAADEDDGWVDSGEPCRPRSTTPCWRTRPGAGRGPRGGRHAPAPRPRATRPGSPAARRPGRRRRTADNGLTDAAGPARGPARAAGRRAAGAADGPAAGRPGPRGPPGPARAA